VGGKFPANELMALRLNSPYWNPNERKILCIAHSINAIWTVEGMTGSPMIAAPELHS
jgi:hypothetical protein